MNMNKALQNLYHAVSGSTTTKVNISKLLVDIHYAITGVESSVKNNWSRIIDSMATNWPEGGGGGGGSSDFSTANVTVINQAETPVEFQSVLLIGDDDEKYLTVSTPLFGGQTKETEVVLYNGVCVDSTSISTDTPLTIETTGDIEITEETSLLITGDGTITIS